MGRGPSGRVVVEIDPRLKRDLYSELARDGLTLKQWFIHQAEAYLAQAQQLALFAAEQPPRYGDADEEDEP